MDALVITLREGIEAALVIGVIIAFVRKAGRPELARPALAGAGVAIAFSIAAAWLLQALKVPVDNPVVEGVLYLVAAVAVATMVVWMLRSGRSLRQGIESRLGTLVSGPATAAAAAGLFAFAFFMVAREGVETVLFLTALTLGRTANAGMLLGALAGLGLAVLYGYLFLKGSAKVDLRLFFGLTAAVLVLLAVKLVIGGVHEFEEAGIIPMSESMAVLFDNLAASTAIDWLFLVALVIPFAAPLIRRLRSGDPTPPGDGKPGLQA